MASQQEVSVESGRDQTHVKDVINSENLIQEEGHHSGAVDMTGQDEPTGQELVAQPILSEVQPKPVQKVKPFNQTSSEDQDEEALSLQRQVTGHIEPAGQEPFLSEEPLLNLSVNWPTLGSSLFDSHNSMASQQEVSIESGRDQTHVKDVINSENLIQEEGHHSGAVDNSRLCHIGVEQTLAPERDEGEEEL